MMKINAVLLALLPLSAFAFPRGDLIIKNYTNCSVTPTITNSNHGLGIEEGEIVSNESYRLRFSKPFFTNEYYPYKFSIPLRINCETINTSEIIEIIVHKDQLHFNIKESYLSNPGITVAFSGSNVINQYSDRVTAIILPKAYTKPIIQNKNNNNHQHAYEG